jgi:alkyl hydroperoxide reductase subunit AhpC
LGKELGVRFALLSDRDLRIAQAFGAADDEGGIAWPSVFLIDGGRIAWRSISKTYQERVLSAEILAAVDKVIAVGSPNGRSRSGSLALRPTNLPESAELDAH